MEMGKKEELADYCKQMLTDDESGIVLFDEYANTCEDLLLKMVDYLPIAGLKVLKSNLKDIRHQMTEYEKYLETL